MTHDEMIAVIQAAKDGKAIQYRRRDWRVGQWEPCIPHPQWDFHTSDYRVAPEKPRRCWVWNHGEGPRVSLRASPPPDGTEYVELTPAVRAACEAARIDVEDAT